MSQQIDFLESDVLPRLFAEKLPAPAAFSSECVRWPSRQGRWLEMAALRCFHCGTDNKDHFILSWPSPSTDCDDERRQRQSLELDCVRCGGLTTLCVNPSDCTVAGSCGESGGVECLSCGNNDEKLVQSLVNTNTRTLVHVRCLVCDLQQTFGTVDVCGSEPHRSLIVDQINHDIEEFEKEKNARNKQLDDAEILKPVVQLSDIHTSVRRRRQSAVATEKSKVDKVWTDIKSLQCTEKTVEHSLFRRRIHNLSDLRHGDHIAFHRNYLVWHHAIVVEANPATSEITMIHYNGAPKKLDGKLISVRLETEVVDAMDQELYRYEYDKCFGPEEVLERAASRLGEADYGPGRNCEHFARWCKTGEEKCFQVDTVKHRLIATGVSTLGKQLEEGVVSMARYLCKEAPEEIFRVGTGGVSYLAAIQDRALNLFSEGTDKMAYGMKWGALAGNMAVNFAIEAANFGIDVSHEYQWYREGKISFDDLRQQAAKTGCECIGGFLGSTAGGIILQLLIPIPFIGGFLGCALGNIFGRLIGAGIGKQLHKR